MKYKLTLNGRSYEVEVGLADPMLMQEYQTYAPSAPAAPAAPVAEAAPIAAPAAVPVATGEGECVDAPMPGNILKVTVAVGQTVAEGDVVVVLEAMKVENEITAPKSGTVTHVLVLKGATVDTGAPLVFIR